MSPRGSVIPMRGHAPPELAPPGDDAARHARGRRRSTSELRDRLIAASLFRAFRQRRTPAQEDKVCIKVMEEMAQYITSILKSAPQIVMSWGYHQPSVYKEDGMEGLRFRVQGFKHTGYVAVLYNPGSDYFEVELQDDMGHAKTRVEDVCFTELVDKIDELVERTDNYDADIEVWKNTPESDPDKQAAKDLGKLVCELQELGIGGDIIIID